MNPKVSLILTTYNCEEYLEQTLENIEKQDYENQNELLKETNKQLEKEYQDLVFKKSKMEKEIADKEKTEKEAEKDAYNMLDAL